MFSLPTFFHSHRVFPNELRMLFVAKLIRTLGVQFTTFFLPIFLYQIGERVNLFPISPFQNGLVFIGLFFLVERIGISLTAIPVGKLIAYIGYQKSIIFSQILYVIVLGLLMVVAEYPALLGLIVLIESVRVPLFWTAYYAMFSSVAQYAHMGESVGTLEFFTKLMQSIIPFLSGIVIVTFGFSAVFAIAATLQMFALAFFFYIPDLPKPLVPTLTEFKSWISEKEFRLVSASFIGKYYADMMKFLWPFFLFLLLGTVERVGFIYFVVFFLSLLFTYFTGIFVDHSHSRRPFSWSGGFLGGLWVFRSLVGSVWGLITIDVLDRLAESIYLPFYESLLLRRGKGKHALSYFTYREAVLSAGGVLFWIVLILYFSFLESWRSFIIFGLVGMILSLQLKEHHKSALQNSKNQEG